MDVLNDELKLDGSKQIYVMSPFSHNVDPVEIIFANSFKGLFKNYTWNEVHNKLGTPESKNYTYLYPVEEGYDYAHVELDDPDFKYKFDNFEDIIESQINYSDSPRFIEYVKKVYLNMIKNGEINE